MKESNPIFQIDHVLKKLLSDSKAQQSATPDRR